ncbi:M50 family metallopeptidase [Pedococcus sp. KACC 23699]|uniref:M50 family metallopeptidase n=1 Tax=Pedococcus sp. KACC 23699 TaxID=3149228 RepID=A0AAU7JR22_9MICO
MTMLLTSTGGADLWAQVTDRLHADPGSVPHGPGVVVVLAIVVAVVLVPTWWTLARVGVTVVHELGHGIVGTLCGRRFTGLVLRGDMSGHAVTVGRARGPGRILCTWSGYPAPAVVGAFSLHAAGGGWAAPVLAGTSAILLVSLVRVRSLYTAGVMLGLTAVTALLWWWAAPSWQGGVLLGTGAFLLVGAWKHLAAVLSQPGAGSDPAVLATLTPVPRWLWNASFLAVLAASSWWAARGLLGMG